MTGFGRDPLVSVVIPCYNQGTLLPEAIESVLGQKYCNVEVVVVNDGSTDDTERAAAAFGDRIRVISKINAGLSAARNTGILHARGVFIQFLDADDFILPDAIEQFMRVFHSAPASDVCYGSWQELDREGRILRNVAPDVESGEDMFHRLLRGNVFPCHAALVRRSALANSSLFDTQLRSFEDWDLWLRLAAAGARFVAAPDAIVAYRQYPGSMSRNYDRMRDSGFAVLAKRISCHANCRECLLARRRGMQTMRYYLYVNLLEPELKALRAEKGPRPMAHRLWLAAIADPGEAAVILRIVARRILSRFRGALRLERRASPEVPN